MGPLTKWLAGAALAGIGALALGHWWQLRREDENGRTAALKGCTEQVGDEAQCKALVEERATDCGVIARHPSGPRGRTLVFNQNDFTECVVVGPKEILQRRADAAARAARGEHIDAP
jgi:hypothetical protein